MRLINLPRFHDARGALTVVEDTLFPIRRIYYICNVPGGKARGGHAHRNLERLLIAVAGGFNAVVDDGRSEQVCTLDRSDRGLYLPRMTWLTLTNFTPDAVCLVLASAPYDGSDYLRDYVDFLREVQKELDGC